jgi:hypothetical protein
VRNSLLPEKKKSFHKIQVEEKSEIKLPKVEKLNNHSSVHVETQKELKKEPSLYVVPKELKKEPSVKEFKKVEIKEPTKKEIKQNEPQKKKESPLNLEIQKESKLNNESNETKPVNLPSTLNIKSEKEQKPSKYQEEEELEFSKSVHGDYRNSTWEDSTTLECSHQATFENEFDEIGALDEFQMDDDEETNLYEGPFAILKTAIINQEDLNNLMPKQPQKNSPGILNIVSRSPTKSTPPSAFQTDFEDEEIGFIANEDVEGDELFHTQDGTGMDPDFDEVEMGIVPNEEYFSVFSVTQNSQVDQKKLKKKILKPEKKNILSKLSPRNKKKKGVDALFNVEFQEEEMEYQPKDE